MTGALAGAPAGSPARRPRAKGHDIAVDGPGQTGWGENYLGRYSLASAFGAEVLATFILGLVVLATTRKGVSTEFAGLAIGPTATVLLLTFINVAGASLNPARSLDPRYSSAARALAQLWLFLLAPVIGGCWRAYSHGFYGRSNRPPMRTRRAAAIEARSELAGFEVIAGMAMHSTDRWIVTRYNTCQPSALYCGTFLYLYQFYLKQCWRR
jgi:hypothetical protein